MKEKKLFSKTMILVAIILIFTLPLMANYIQVTNVSVDNSGTGSDWSYAKFDISWEHSWRTSSAPNNWDAAWVFAKWKLHSGTDWAHCTLSSNDSDHSVTTDNGVGVTIDAVTDGKGIFIHRSSDASGNNNWDGVKLRWDYGTDGVADDATVDVEVFAIEMVYIPQASFSLYSGTHADLNSNFKSGNTISSEALIAEQTIIWDVDYFRSGSGNQSQGADNGFNPELCGDYPKGYMAIYCMKYEISQEQYADFLSLLTDAQDGNRYPNENGNYRHTISGTYGNYTAGVPNRACNYLQWADGLAYADWAGLRPMTELEYEKICRGPETADTDYAWGDNTIYGSAYNISNDGTATATVNNSTTAGNSSNSTTNNVSGPFRCGIFADAGSDRQESGATYYGVMEMSGNLIEHCITVAKYYYFPLNNWFTTSAGSFDGLHGDGLLSTTGFSNVDNWPSQTVTSGSAAGASIRGNGWYNNEGFSRISNRRIAAWSIGHRYSHFGFRAVRTQ